MDTIQYIKAVLFSFSVVVLLCGGNIDTTLLGRCLDRGLAADGRLVRLTVLVDDRPGGLQGFIGFLFEQGVRYISKLSDIT